MATAPIIFKLIVTGESNTGKTSLINRYINNAFDENYAPTIGVDFTNHNVTINDSLRAKIQIWDTAGQERFQSIVATYFRGCSGAIVTFSKSDCSSLPAIIKWVNLCRSENQSIPVMVVETKVDGINTDPHHHPDDKDFEKQLSDLNCLYCACSSKTGFNVSKAFNGIIGAMIQKDRTINALVAGPSTLTNNALDITPTSNKKQSCCN